jgi:hypothetical protein
MVLPINITKVYTLHLANVFDPMLISITCLVQVFDFELNSFK